MTSNSTPPNTQRDADDRNADWSRAYWAVLANQVVVGGLVAFLAIGLLRESYQACKAASMFLPDVTKLYFGIGVEGLALGWIVPAGLSLAIVGLRRRLAAAVAVSVSFVVSTVFLGASIFAAMAPFLVLVRDMLPPDQRW